MLVFSQDFWLYLARTQRINRSIVQEIEYCIVVNFNKSDKNSEALIFIQCWNPGSIGHTRPFVLLSSTSRSPKSLTRLNRFICSPIKDLLIWFLLELVWSESFRLPICQCIDFTLDLKTVHFIWFENIFFGLQYWRMLSITEKIFVTL